MTIRMVSDNTRCFHLTLGSQAECWHGPCRVGHVFRDESVWVRNREGNARRLPLERIREV